VFLKRGGFAEALHLLGEKEHLQMFCAFVVNFSQSLLSPIFSPMKIF
jgi:hypothetical protein